MAVNISLTATEATVITTLLEEADLSRFADWTDNANEPMTDEFFEVLISHIQDRMTQ